MSVLLRHPATVPSLFSRAVDPDPRTDSTPNPWGRFARSAPLVWAAVVLIEVPLVKAAAVGFALPQ